MEPKDTFFSRKLNINCKGELIDLNEPKIMGILNITPDSFYDGGKYSSMEDIMNQVRKMIDEGVDMIDIGTYSSRPGAENISVTEELKRLTPVLEEVRKTFPKIIISVDTFRTEVALEVVKNYSVDIINDISSGDLDPNMFTVIADLHVPYIMMHMQGSPQNMQNNPQYENVVKSVMSYFEEKINKLKLLGVKDIIIDPGFGFGKTIEHNYQLLKHLNDFRMFELPILIGISRKSMISKPLDLSAEESLNGTSVLNTFALLNGANIIRVHDVKEAKEAVRLIANLNSAKVDNWDD